jgi:hypothetical protein
MLLVMTSARRPARRGSSLLLLGWIAGLLGAIAVLTLAGRGALAAPSILDPAAWGPWAAGRDALTIAFTVLRLLTLALAWYLLGATVIGGVARLARWRRLVAVADVLTVPAVRRLLQSALGLGLATAALSVGSPSTGPATQPPTAATLTMTAEVDAARVVMTPLTDAGETMTPVAQPPVPPPAAEEWTAEQGDHFWSIAERILARAWGRSPTDAEVVAYWDRLVAVNADRLADPGNPDLIYPGQTFEVPRPPKRPATP